MSDNQTINGKRDFVKIVFEGPSYWDSVDEDKFFEWIYSLPNYQSVKGQGSDLILELSEPIEQATINQLFILFKRWEVEFDSLVAFKKLNDSHIRWVNEFLS